MSIAEERQENRIRKLANRRGLSVCKDRATIRSLNHHGLFSLMNPYTNSIVMGERFDVSLEDIESYLNPEPKE